MIESVTPRRGRTPKTPPPALAARLVDARLKIGATQKALAERLGCAWRSVQDYEQGKAIPGGQVLASYGELGVDLNWLVTGNETVRTDRESETVFVPHFQLSDVNADFADSASCPSTLQLNRSWLKRFQNGPSEDSEKPQLASISIEDDAMVPELPVGSVVIFKTHSTEPITPGLYVLPLGKQLAVRLFRTSLDGNTEIVELKHPARPIVIDRSSDGLHRAYRAVATLIPQVSPVETSE